MELRRVDEDVRVVETREEGTYRDGKPATVGGGDRLGRTETEYQWQNRRGNPSMGGRDRQTLPVAVVAVDQST